MFDMNGVSPRSKALSNWFIESSCPDRFEILIHDSLDLFHNWRRNLGDPPSAYGSIRFAHGARKRGLRPSGDDPLAAVLQRRA
jgi:hypothetical protein